MNAGIRKLLALILSLSFLFAGCGQAAPAAGTAEPSTETAVTQPTETEPTNPYDALGVTSSGTVDLMEKAVLISDYREGGLNDQKFLEYGAGAFADYGMLMRDPLRSADYVWQMRALAGDVAADGEGLGAFSEALLAQYGPRFTFVTDYTVHTDLNGALEALFTAAGDTAGLENARKKLAGLTPDASAALTEFICAAAYAYSLTDGEIGKLSREDWDMLCAFTFCAPAADDTQILSRMRTIDLKIDLSKLLCAGLVLLSAGEILASALPAGTALTADGKGLTVSTPAGDIILGSAGEDSYRSPRALLIWEPGGNDTYDGSIASGSSRENPLSVAIDLSGDDLYSAGDEDGPTQGAGILGTGILFDMAGKDTYTASRLAQGCCILGMGVLFDSDGDDTYTLNYTGQGAGFYGLALLTDSAGNDSYQSHGYAQASAGPRSVAYLLDMAGNDTYYVAPYLLKDFPELHYGQFPKSNGNWSQGCGWGQRVIDLSGGNAGLLDLSGNDSYTGGIWVQGTGYWSGVGFLFDSAGDDFYNSSYYSQASVAHFGVGILADVGGNDTHTAKSANGQAGDGASLGFTWDRGVALFVNDGGNDIYIAKNISGGSAVSEYDDKGYKDQDMTYAIFIDTEGDDIYQISSGRSSGWGRGGYLIDCAGEDDIKALWHENGTVLYNASTEGGVFIDHAVCDETPYQPVLRFWENAQKTAGF